MSDESVFIPNCFVLIKKGTKEFDDDVRSLSEKVQLCTVGRSLLSPRYSQQSCRDNETVPGIN
eukprot:4794232-Ditylum_brightwellii.AAC.1